MTHSEQICIANHHTKLATELAQRLALPLCDMTHKQKIDSKHFQWLDWVNDKKDPSLKLALCSHHQGPVFIDFLGGKKAHRRQFGGGKGQPLVRAMGHLENSLPKVLDATAGMGGDSYVLASLGFNVTMVERSFIVSALLDDALCRAKSQLDTTQSDDVKADLGSNLINDQVNELQQSINNLSLVNADSACYLLENKPKIDVVYMDPMYPEKKKKAAAKKEMQALQNLVGPDLDSTALLDAALQTAQFRVVVKRPKGAEPVQSQLNNIQPSTQISSPNTRYDIYVIKALRASGQLL